MEALKKWDLIMKFKMIKIISVLALFLMTNQLVSSKELPTVSVFDVKQEKVVKVMPLTSEFKNSVLGVLQSSPAHYEGFSMNPVSGLVFHLPFPTKVQIPHAFYLNKVSEIYLFLEHGQKPKALLFQENRRQIIVVLNYDNEKFIKQNGLSDIWFEKTNSSDINNPD
ncbi:hypothetical protein [Cohnella silvisoli]|uniref:Uncharacterized protein n=1 Tax=Cohnella silvisoli TaxID=2873699 RepID=A0ABV1L1B4_9BACL|nr:hypothetical protein [Cohnella silvisoli]MCD9025487.1 hypothetical protein [Cohnella silvisoli]